MIKVSVHKKKQLWEKYQNKQYGRRKDNDVSAGTWLAQGKLELQLQMVSQAAAGVRTTGKENSRTDIMVTDTGTKKDFTQELGSVSPQKRPKQKKRKIN